MRASPSLTVTLREAGQADFCETTPRQLGAARSCQIFAGRRQDNFGRAASWEPERYVENDTSLFASLIAARDMFVDCQLSWPVLPMSLVGTRERGVLFCFVNSGSTGEICAPLVLVLHLVYSVR